MAVKTHIIRKKILWRLVAPLTFLTFLNSLDRVNISFAALQMNAELGLSPERYGFGVGLFFFGYLACQFPHTALLQRIGARRWIFAATLGWAIAATCMAFIQNAGQLYAVRIVLGVAESGFAPGIVYIMSQWMPKRFRAFTIAGSMLAIPISVVLGGPLSGWLMGAHTRWPSMPGWRFMFLVEGLVTLLVALLTPFFFVDRLTFAHWLEEDEKAWLQVTLARERIDSEARTRPPSLLELLRSPKLWAMAGVWFSLMAGAYGIIYWLPQVIKQLSGLNDLSVSVLSALPWLSLGAGMILNALHSDHTQERLAHIGVPALLAAAGLFAAASVGSSGLALACLVVGSFGLGAAQGAFWTLPSVVLEGPPTARGITLINLIGSSGGLIAPPVIGLIRARTGSFTLAVATLAALLCMGAGLLLWLRLHTVSEPRRNVARSTRAGVDKPESFHA
jgi:ACS family tartrate transporter-like MFS transporter